MFPYLFAGVGVCDRGVGDSVPFDANTFHGVGKRGVYLIGQMLVDVTHKLVCAAADLFMELLLFLGRFVDRSDVSEVYGNAGGDSCVGAIEHMFQVSLFIFSNTSLAAIPRRNPVTAPAITRNGK